jgi:hypothetical protein
MRPRVGNHCPDFLVQNMFQSRYRRIPSARHLGNHLLRPDLLASSPQLGRVHDVGVRPGRQAENFGVVAIDQWQVDDVS